MTYKIGNKQCPLLSTKNYEFFNYILGPQEDALPLEDLDAPVESLPLGCLIH